jgi:hypothetical protein
MDNDALHGFPSGLTRAIYSAGAVVCKIVLMRDSFLGISQAFRKGAGKGALLGLSEFDNYSASFPLSSSHTSVPLAYFAAGCTG